MPKKKETKKIKTSELFAEFPNLYEVASKDDMTATFEFAEEYKSFLDDSKTEREFAANAIPMEGNVFVGWYDAEGNLVSSEAELSLEYGTAYTLEARFEESEAPTDPEPPTDPDDPPKTGAASVAGAAVMLAAAGASLVTLRKKQK